MARHPISMDQLDLLEVDDDTRLYWKGTPVLTETRVSLRTFELGIAAVAAVAALVAALHPFGLTFGWW